MPVSLDKDKLPVIPRHGEALEFVSINLAWDARKNFGPEFDLDLACFLLNGDYRLMDENDFIFYNNFSSVCGGARFWGDNRVGENDEAESELITLDFPKIKDAVERIVITVSIHEALKRGQTFGLIHNVKISISNRQNGKLLAMYELDESFKYDSAIVLGEFHRNDGNWEFKDIAKGHAGDLSALAARYGLGIA